MRYILLSSLLLLSACAEKPLRKQVRYHPASYAAEGMMIETPAPEHPEPKKDLQFYHKDCTPTAGKAYYSNTSYYCDMAP